MALSHHVDGLTAGTSGAVTATSPVDTTGSAVAGWP
jgi:hypothetical protein